MRLTTLAVSFVGFSAMGVALRRARGAELDALHMHFVRMFIEGGLAVAALGLQPALLSFATQSIASLDEKMIWRVCSFTAAALFTAYLITLGKRRRTLGPSAPPMMFSIVLNFVVSSSAVIALWFNALRPNPNALPYLFALTWFLILGGWVFAQNLDRFLRPGQ